MTGTEYTLLTPSQATLVALSGDDITIKISEGDAQRYLDNLMTSGKPALFSFNGHYVEPISYVAPNLTGKLIRDLTVVVTKDEKSAVAIPQQPVE
jgi:hypothetical protein